MFPLNNGVETESGSERLQRSCLQRTTAEFLVLLLAVTKGFQAEKNPPTQNHSPTKAFGSIFETIRIHHRLPFEKDKSRFRIGSEF
jgi:hypothetical protein